MPSRILMTRNGAVALAAFLAGRGLACRISDEKMETLERTPGRVRHVLNRHDI